MKIPCMLLIVCVTGLPPATLRAQAPAAEQDTIVRGQYWVNAGLGAEHEGEYLGTGFGVSVMRTPSHVVTARITYLEEFQLFCLFEPCSAPDYRVDAGVLYGLAAQSGWMLASASAGVGLIAGRMTVYEESGGREESFTTAGLPLEVQLDVRPSSRVGIGATAIGNLNSRDSFAGILVGFQFGRLRPAPAVLAQR